MALWKLFRGNHTALDTVEKHDGYVYFCDDGSLHFDYTDANGVLHRKQINAKEAEALTGYSIETLINSSDVEIPTSKAVLDALSNKVDKISGKGLSTNDYTTAEKNKLAGLADVATSGSYNDLTNKPTIPTVPTKVSAFENDKGYLTSYTETDPTVPSWAKASSKPSYTASEVGAVPTSRKVNGQALSADITIDIPDALANLSSDAAHRTVSDTEKATWNAKSDFSGSYNDLTNKPTIPSISGLATETYVDNKVASIVDSSPEALNTLNELAAALGDDPNFATTVSTEIGKKVDKTTTVNGHELSGDVTVTKSDVGLGNVPNVATNDQTPTFTEATALENIATSEKVSTLFGKIKKAITDLIAHLANKSNPHGVTKAQVGLGSVENKSSATIRGELTKANVTDALGYTPPETDTKYTHPSYTAKSSGLYKVTVDATGHVSGATAVTKADITGLGIPAQDTTYTHPASHPASMITGLADVATSGSYDDLSDKPTIPSAYTHPTSHPASMITGLATVATSGSYNDLSNKPTIPAAYTHPSYTARTGKPTVNQTPAFGGTATVSQITSDATGHVTGATDRTITIPSTLSNGTGTAGLIKTSSTVTSNSGYTACPVISGVPYYKDTNTTYSLSSFGITATAAELNYCDGVTSDIQTQLDGKMSSSPISIELNQSGDLSGFGGFIDFHFNGSSSDYTSRIIENASGTLEANGVTFTDGTASASTFNGNLNGLATWATHDASGNNIASTYATKAEAAKIVTGSYTGTGTCGSGNSTGIWGLSFEPKAILISAWGQWSVTHHAFAVKGTHAVRTSYYSGSEDMAYFTWESNAVSWWNGEGADKQLNTSGTTYHYVIIG